MSRTGGRGLSSSLSVNAVKGSRCLSHLIMLLVKKPVKEVEAGPHTAPIFVTTGIKRLSQQPEGRERLACSYRKARSQFPVVTLT